MLRKWDTDNKALHQKCLDEVIARVADIDDPGSIGQIAAQDIVDVVIEHLGPEIYNKALADAQKMVGERMGDIEYGFEDLKQVSN